MHWRPGILHRLWEAGVRGKVWRIIKEMLTGTKARVRTNYGDTEEFEIEQGVTQGGVLSALLFIIFITPMAQEISTSPMILEGMKLLTQFFADDCTLRPRSQRNRNGRSCSLGK